MKPFHIFPAERSWQVRIRASFGKEFREELKAFPGISWAQTKWGEEWVAPHESLPHIRALCERSGYEVRYAGFAADRAPWDPTRVPRIPTHPHLRPFQVAAVEKASAGREGAFLFNFEMGLGKTAACIDALRLRKVENVLVVCPAMVRRTWLRELDKWWTDHPPITEVEDGTEANEVREVRGVVVTSYGLLPKMPVVGAGAIVLDELHYLQSESAARTMACVRALRTNPDAWVAGLTGTLIAGNPLSIHQPLNVLFPGRWSTRNRFAARYCLSDGDTGMRSYHGFNPDTAAELRARLDLFSARATKRDPEIAATLPKVIFQRLYTNRVSRVSDSAQAVYDAYAQGARRLVCLTDRKDTAERIGTWLRKACRGGAWVQVITGDLSVGRRDDAIQAAIAHGTATIIVATMQSVGIGIDLTYAEDVTFAELNFSSNLMEQAIARFGDRLSSMHGATIKFMIDERGDAKAEGLARKTTEAGKIVDPGLASGALEKLDEIERKFVVNAEEMQKMTTTYVGGDY